MSGSSLAPRPPKHLGLRATLGAILGAGVAYAAGCDVSTCITSASLAAVTMRIALIDLKLRIIRDRDVLAMLMIGSAWIIWSSLNPASEIVLALLQGFFYAATFQAIRILYFRIRGREGLGIGDIKIGFIAGPLIDPHCFFLSLCLASSIGILFISLRNSYYQRRRSRYSYIPFGSALTVSIYYMWFVSKIIYGHDIIIRI